MAGAQRTAFAVWRGSLTDGSGTVRPESGAFAEVPVTWKARTGGDQAMTSPEELLAAAHAVCFSMALSHGLTQAGTPPDQLDVTTTCSFTPKPEGGFRISGTRINVVGRVPGISADAFGKAAVAAGKNCPVSSALSPDVEISVTAELG
jgi:lipoyl-dependent peroxiredoxin